MGEIVFVDRDDEVAIVAIDNPPVNAMSHAVRAALQIILSDLARDDTVKAIVLSCAGRTFVAGADIKEFGQPPRAPELREVIATLDAITKPAIAAIHGSALGGGLELALACHFRVAHPAATMGLPEVKLGLLPGAGGTVRLPRLVGARTALRMIVSGEPVSADQALTDGLVDVLAAGDLRADAVSFARRMLAGAVLPVPVRERDIPRPVDWPDFDLAAKALTQKARGLEAPAACVEAVHNALTLPFKEALRLERELFERLIAGDQSRALRHVFFAEREAAKVPGVGKADAPRRIERVGVVGAGTMGGGIAMVFVNAGIPVTLVEAETSALERGLALIERNYAGSVSRGSISREDATARRQAITGATDLAALSHCHLVVEAVFEDMAVKKEVFAKLDTIVRPGAILATNTSYLDVNDILSATSRPCDGLGLHFFSPANVMKLVEIVRGGATRPDVLATAMALARRIGKIPVVVGVGRGFVGNRMLAVRAAEGENLLLEGATPTQVDAAFTGFGWPMGPYQMVDLAGLDIGWRNRKSLDQTAVVADALCEMGRFGQKTGQGFYRYESGSRSPIADPEVERLIAEKARERGIERRRIDAEEIVERTHLPMINEGFRVLAEGIASRSSDIDMIWIHGYGFPAGKGGPMFWAQQQGLAGIVDRLRYWQARSGRTVFEPSPALIEAVGAA